MSGNRFSVPSQLSRDLSWRESDALRAWMQSMQTLLFMLDDTAIISVLPIVLDPTNGRVGINMTPGATLDITDNVSMTSDTMRLYNAFGAFSETSVQFNANAQGGANNISTARIYAKFLGVGFGNQSLAFQVGDSGGTLRDVLLLKSNRTAELSLSNAVIGGRLFTQTANVTVANSVAETTMFGAGSGSLSIPANALAVGRTLRFRFMGNISGLGSPNIRFRAKIGAATIADTTAATSGLTLVTIHGFIVDCEITCRSVGGAGTVIGQIVGTSDGGQMSVGSKTAATVNIDTTIANVIDFTILWGAASASNSITVSNATVDLN